jgi:hypothetical protein
MRVLFEKEKLKKLGESLGVGEVKVEGLERKKKKKVTLVVG